jgi:beta-glucanase (GH16 family)
MAKKRLLFGFTLALLSLAVGCPRPPLSGDANPLDKPGWKLVFHDEFDGPELDTSLWMTGFPWGRCSDIAYNTDTGNISLVDGAVRMTAKKETINGYCFHWDADGTFTPFYQDFDYSTGMLYSVQAFKYGYFECRFRAPAGKGFNAAFWLYGPEATEADIFEIVSSDEGAAQMTLHWKQDDPLVGTSQWINHIHPSGPAFTAGYHTFAFEWASNSVAWYLDNWKIPDTLMTRFIEGRHIPNVDMNVILTLGIGCMDGTPDASTPFPADFVVDYVRVYQVDDASAVRVSSS